MWRNWRANPNASAARDRGEGAFAYMAVLLLVAGIVGALFLTGVGGTVAGGMQAAVCKVFHAAGLVKQCAPVAMPPSRPGRPIADPDEPTHACTIRNERRYLEETVTIPVRYVDVRTNSRGTIVLTEKVQPDGTRVWEVEDFTWGEGAVATPTIRKSTIDADAPGGPAESKGPDFGAWAGVSITNGKIYSFTNEKEARDFFNMLKDHRIGNPVKFSLRTNPLTGWAVWGAGKLPWVGDDIDRFMGGSEPDRKPSAEYLEGGLTAGFNGDLPLGDIVSAPFKGRGWLVNGQRKDTKSGNTTIYFQDRAEGELAVQIDMTSIWNRLPKGLRERASKGIDDALDAAIGAIEEQLKGEYGRDVMMSPDQRDEIKKSISANPDVGINVKGRIGVRYELTLDKNGNPVGFKKIDHKQLIFYLRGGAKKGGTVGDERVTGGGNAQWSWVANRWETEKTLDLKNPDDRQAAERFFGSNPGDFIAKSVNPFTRWSGRGGLDDYFANGGGTMARYTFDTDADSLKGTVNGERSTTTPKDDTKSKKSKRKYGLLEIGDEDETNTLASAEYYKPGQGWVKWSRCTG
ncbi:hypothetical protein [Spirillospora sp. NPDC029432]|uniref:hypothetical protein n=1 Tax=Spirillospora sp. NPDC029432 TaxID=3154599 RepID=UPI0034559428